jgi:hypothetical protein
VRKLIRGGFVNVKALRITGHSESRAQSRLKSDPLGGSLKSAPLAGAQRGAWPRLNEVDQILVLSKRLRDQPLVASGGIGRKLSGGFRASILVKLHFVHLTWSVISASPNRQPSPFPIQ